MLRKFGCFFLDACVVLTDVFQNKEYKDKVEKFNKNISEENIDCFTTKSVDNECKNRIKQIIEFAGTIVVNLKLKLAHKKIIESRDRGEHVFAPMAETDFELIEQIFVEKHKELKSHDKDVYSTEKELLSALEHWAVSFLEENIRSVKTRSFELFFYNLTDELMKICTDFQRRFDINKSLLDPKDVVPDTADVDAIKGIGIEKKDAYNVACVKKYQTKNDIWSVFVSLDYKDIVLKADELKKHQVLCSDPIHAIHRLKRIYRKIGEPPSKGLIKIHLI